MSVNRDPIMVIVLKSNQSQTLILSRYFMTRAISTLVYRTIQVIVFSETLLEVFSNSSFVGDVCLLIVSMVTTHYGTKKVPQ